MVQELKLLEGELLLRFAYCHFALLAADYSKFRAYCAWVFSYEWFEQRKFEDEGFTSLEDFIVRFYRFTSFLDHSGLYSMN